MALSNFFEALTEFQNVANKSKAMQAEFRTWGDRTIQFIVKGGASCYLIIKNGRVSIEKGEAENTDLTFTALDGYLVKLLTGQEDYTSLEILGNIAYKGEESDKNKFIAVIGLFVSALFGELDDVEEF